jgi:hypothetical protein
MSESLFGTATPVNQNEADGATNYALGTRFTPGVNGSISAGKWWFPTTYSWPATSANLTATSSNGWLAVNPGALTYPTTISGNTATYFADVVFDPTPTSTWSYGYDVKIGG